MNLNTIYFLHEIGGRKTQEDYIWPPAGTASAEDKIFIICDGVGGSENGELASKLISEFVASALQEIPASTLSATVINDILLQAQQKLIDHAAQYALNTDMATTFTLLVLNDDKAFIAWCGDSRVYHIRKESVLYKTSDHSLVNTLVKKGEITEQEARSHPQKNIILKAIKADYSPIEAEANWITNIEDGDYFMLCTDGLLENISDNELTFLLRQENTNSNGLINAFQQYCFNKTRDNYSMYLLKINKAHVQAIKKNKKGLLFLSSFIIIVTGVISGSYFYLNGQKELNEREVKTPVFMENADTASANLPDTTNLKDSLPYFEIVNERNRNDTIQPPNRATILKGSKDTIPENETATKDKNNLHIKKDSIKKTIKIKEQPKDSIWHPVNQ